MLVRPIQTEKAYNAQTQNTYIFVVPLSASKQGVMQAISTQYGVTVTDIRIAVRKGKATRFSRGKHAYPGTTYRQDRKIAYVTLEDGDKIKVFDEEPMTEQEDSKPETKAQSQAKVDSKTNSEADSTKKAGLFTRRRTGNRGDK